MCRVVLHEFGGGLGAGRTKRVEASKKGTFGLVSDLVSLLSVQFIY